MKTVIGGAAAGWANALDVNALDVKAAARNVKAKNVTRMIVLPVADFFGYAAPRILPARREVHKPACRIRCRKLTIEPRSGLGLLLSTPVAIPALQIE
jgi:hypothetical protein